MSSVVYLIFFFFQAEDGIRDRTVTGVQTCALPICREPVLGARPDALHTAGRSGDVGRRDPLAPPRRSPGDRSEERRVGKECRSLSTRDHQKTNTHTHNDIPAAETSQLKSVDYTPVC